MNETENKNEQNDIPHCKHFVIRKKRFCRMTLKKGLEFCGEHQPKSEITESSDPRLRISCPLDNTHTCYANKLNKHLKKCNAKFDNSIPYIIKGINSETNNILSTRQLADVPISHILEVIKKINKLYNDIIKNSISENILNHELLEEEIKNPDYGPNTLKHLHQTSSLLGHIKNSNLIQPRTCFVEFGAGKGQLSFWVSKAVSSVSDTSVLLVERASLRHKLDNKLDKTENNIERIRADIADLVLEKVDVVKKCQQIVGVTKHLCGDATDLALRCMMNCSGKKINGLVMAFCCHHRCHWNLYTGKIFFEKNGLSTADFDVICGLVSWATCGTGKSRTKNNNEFKNQDAIDVKTNRDAELGLTKQEKELVGKKCKMVLDYGRYDFLQQKGFHCDLFYYVTSDVSLENVCIVAYK